MASPVEDIGAKQIRAVTPADNKLLQHGVARALWIGVAGDVAVITEDDTAAVTITNAPVGVLPVRAKVVMSTNTTATGIVALY